MGANMNQPNLTPRNLSAAVRIRLGDIEAWLDAGVSRTEIAETLQTEYGFPVTVRALDQALYRARKRREDGLHNPKHNGLHNPKMQQPPVTSEVAAETASPIAEPATPKTLEDEGRSHFTKSDFSKIDEEAEKEMEAVKNSKAARKGY